MSKRAEEMATKAYPVVIEEHTERDLNKPRRLSYINGYEQAEKDTTDKAAKWIREHWREYIWGPDADGCIGFGLWENDFRKAMED